MANTLQSPAPVAVVRSRPRATAPKVLLVATITATLDAFMAPFVARLQERGAEVYAAAHGQPTTERFRSVPLEQVPWQRSPLSFDNVRAFWRVRQAIRAGGFDSVLLNTPIASFVTRLAIASLPREVRPVTVYLVHGYHFLEGQSRLTNAVFRLAEVAVRRQTDLVMVINDEDWRAAVRWKLGAKVVKLDGGVGLDLDHYAPAGRLREWTRDDVALRITCVGELTAGKRQEWLVRALCRPQLRRDHLTLVGDGPMMGTLRDLADDLGVADRVHFAGHCRDVRPWIEQSDVIALPSAREGLARCLMEAVAMGRPVVTVPTRGCADVVRGGGGLVAADAGFEAFAAAIEMVHDHDLASRLASEALAARDRFGLDQVLSTFDRDVVPSLLGSGPTIEPPSDARRP